jgi:hypothetical protein
MEKKMRYLWVIGKTLETKIIDDPIAIFRDGSFDENSDRIYQIGQEVKIEVVVRPVTSLFHNSVQQTDRANINNFGG